MKITKIYFINLALVYVSTFNINCTNDQRFEHNSSFEINSSVQNPVNYRDNAGRRQGYWKYANGDCYYVDDTLNGNASLKTSNKIIKLDFIMGLPDKSVYFYDFKLQPIRRYEFDKGNLKAISYYSKNREYSKDIIENGRVTKNLLLNEDKSIDTGYIAQPRVIKSFIFIKEFNGIEDSLMKIKRD